MLTFSKKPFHLALNFIWWKKISLDYPYSRNSLLLSPFFFFLYTTSIKDYDPTVFFTRFLSVSKNWKSYLILLKQPLGGAISKTVVHLNDFIRLSDAEVAGRFYRPFWDSFSVLSTSFKKTGQRLPRPLKKKKKDRFFWVQDLSSD